jgi:hypothetical protein
MHRQTRGVPDGLPNRRVDANKPPDGTYDLVRLLYQNLSFAPGRGAGGHGGPGDPTSGRARQQGCGAERPGVPGAEHGYRPPELRHLPGGAVATGNG